MTGTLSHKFIGALDPERDALFASAVSLSGSGSAAQAERLLQAATREGFAAVEKDPGSDALAAVKAALSTIAKTGEPNAPSSDTGPAEVMPADVWARLVATVQVEAARSAHTRAINPDSVLLSPDPLLAPKKSASPDDAEGFDLSPSFRFLLAGGIAVVVGVGLTIYLATRNSGGAAPVVSPATTSGSHVPPSSLAPAPGR